MQYSIFAIDVVGDSIVVRSLELVSQSAGVVEYEQATQANELMTIKLGQTLIFRGESRKESFGPLFAVNKDDKNAVSDRVKVSGFNLPQVYKKFATLHLIYTQVGDKYKTDCEVVLMHQLLDQELQKELFFLLEESNFKFHTFDSHLLIECKK